MGTRSDDALWAQWGRALDRLEQDLERAEALVVGAPSAWEPPALPGPLPAEMLSRALDIHQRQLAAAERLRHACRATTHHRAYVDHLDASDHDVARFVDVRG